MQNYPQLAPTPEQFERQVRDFVDALGTNLEDYSSNHREVVIGPDGEYEIDITVRFSALNVNYLTLIECKRYSRPVGREKVQSLYAKMQSVGAQKGIVFSTSGFQLGASEYAAAHGIALVELVDGRASYLRRSFDDAPIPWSKVPDYISRIVGWLHDGNKRSLVDPKHMTALAEALGLEPATIGRLP